MTGSFDELRAGLALVAQLLATAGQHTAQAGGLLDEALAELTRLSEQHSESLVPVPLQRAATELGTTRAMINGGGLAVADIEARL